MGKELEERKKNEKKSIAGVLLWISTGNDHRRYFDVRLVSAQESADKLNLSLGKHESESR